VVKDERIVLLCFSCYCYRRCCRRRLRRRPRRRRSFPHVHFSLPSKSRRKKNKNKTEKAVRSSLVFISVNRHEHSSQRTHTQRKRIN
jgi:hypothetical protein